MGVGAARALSGRKIKMDIIWLFFMLSALQPIIKQKLLEASRKRMIGVIEKQRKSRVVLLVHRQETMSLLGFPIFRYIDINDSEEVLRAIHMTDPEIPLDLVLHTPGGLVLAATQIARAIFKHKGKVTVFVPHYAMSGGTLIALAADEIVMDPDAVLGSLDPQLGQHPAASIVRAVEWKTERHQEVDDETVILADVARKDRADARVRAQRPDAAPRLREGRGVGDHLQARRVDVRPPARGRGAAAAPLPYRSPGAAPGVLRARRDTFFLRAP